MTLFETSALLMFIGMHAIFSFGFELPIAVCLTTSKALGFHCRENGRTPCEQDNVRPDAPSQKKIYLFDPFEIRDALIEGFRRSNFWGNSYIAEWEAQQANREENRRVADLVDKLVVQPLGFTGEKPGASY